MYAFDCFLVYALECTARVSALRALEHSKAYTLSNQIHTPSENMHYIALQCNAYFMSPAEEDPCGDSFIYLLEN